MYLNGASPQKNYVLTSAVFLPCCVFLIIYSQILFLSERCPKRVGGRPHYFKKSVFDAEGFPSAFPLVRVLVFILGLAWFSSPARNCSQ